MRPIDADAFLKYILAAGIGKTILEYSESDIGKMIRKRPTIDAVPVVRCRDCKHCDPENHHCDHHMGTAAPLRRKPDDFCSYGEREEGADNG